MIETKGLTGAQSMLRVLGKMGVEKIFASPGSEWSPLWEALAEPGVEGMPQYYSTRHEEVAIGMASGYAKATGKLPAVVIHTTVGALHATMGMRGAVREQVPMVVFAGESIGFGEDEGPDPGGQWLGHLSNMGGPAKLVDQYRQVELRPQYQIDPALDRAARLPARDGWTERAGVCLDADGISVRHDDTRTCRRTWAFRPWRPPMPKASKNSPACLPAPRLR